MRQFLLILFLILLKQHSFAVDINLDISQSIIYLTGAKIKLTYTVKHKRKELEFLKNKSDISLNPDEFYKKILRAKHINDKIDVEHISFTEDKIYSDNGEKVIEANTYTYVFQLFEIQSIEVSPVKFQFTNLTNDNLVYYSPYAYIHSLPPESRGASSFNFKDIINKTEYDNRDYSNYYITLFSILGFVLISLLIYRFNRWNIFQKDKLGNAISQAKNQLDILKAELLNDKAENITDIHKLTNILKHYIERKWDILAISENTHELIDSLKAIDVDPSIIQSIQDFYNHCDRLKFSSISIEKSSLEDALSKALLLLDNLEKHRSLIS